MKNKLFFFLQALFRYCPYKLGINLRNVFYPSFFKEYGKGVRIFDSVVIKFPNEIAIGNDVTINQFCYIVGKGGLRIGNDVMIGAGTKMTTTSHEFEKTHIPMRLQGISFKPITIDHDVWIGFNAVLMGGAIIHTGSIIAAGSVVTGKEFPAYSVLGGVPATIIKQREISEAEQPA